MKLTFEKKKEKKRKRIKFIVGSVTIVEIVVIVLRNLVVLGSRRHFSKLEVILLL